ncbi:MAG: NAD(P)-dependent oxidoreductase [Deinococcota bacterium]
MSTSSLPVQFSERVSTARVLVTGAAGFVGINLVQHLAKAGADVIALTLEPAEEASHKFLTDAASRVTWCLGNVCDAGRLEAIISQHQPNYIIHAAALTGSPELERDNPHAMLEVNVTGSLNMLEACKHIQPKRMIYVSSSGLYGARPPQPAANEDDKLALTSLYAIGKHTSEMLWARYASLYQLDAVSVRLGTVYGPMERPTGSRQRMSALYNAVHASLEGQALKVDGVNIARDFCHVDDVANACVHLLFADNLSYPCYNIAGAQAEPLQVVLEALADAHKLHWDAITPSSVVSTEHADEDHIQLVQMPTQARASHNLSRIYSDTSWQPKYDLRAGSLAYAAWCKKQV